MWNPFASKINTKSVNQQLTGQVTSILPDFPSSVKLGSDSTSILQYSRGYAQACINMISRNVSGLPYYLYRISNSNTGTYAGKSIKSKRDSYIDRRVAKAFSKGDYTLDKIFDHPFIDLIELDDELTTTEMLSIVTSYLLTIGNAYIAVVRDSGGSISKLKVLMSEYMSVQYDKEYNIVSYIYQPALSGYTTRRFNPDQLIHLSRKTAGSIIVGRGVLEDSLMSVSISEEAKKFTNSLLTNHMTPSASIVVKNSIKTEAEAKLIKDKIAEQYSGNNRGKSIVTFGDVDIKNISTKMRDETVLELCEYCKKEITALFGVPLDLLDQSNSNRASILSAKTNFYKMTIFPLANDICDQLSRFIAKEYDTSFLLGFDTQESIENDPQEQADLFKTYIDAGIITKEEAREKLGL